MDLDDPAAHRASLRIPADAIADFKLCAHAPSLPTHRDRCDEDRPWQDDQIDVALRNPLGVIDVTLRKVEPK